MLHTPTTGPPNTRIGPTKADPLVIPTTQTEEEEATEVLYPDWGEVLISHRLLSTILADPEDDTTWLRNNIFCTKCTAKGKVCMVIIDGGSCENMVATTMVEKLGLPIQDHPEPYQLTWLKKGNLVKVTHKYLVQFSIGNKYTDDIWCEVIPMDACHVLLGRPWLYDRRVKHDGFRNTYSFKKDGLRITLAPLNPRDEPQHVAPLTKRDFVGLAKHQSSIPVFGLVIVEENPTPWALPAEVIPLVDEFSDIFPDDIPAGLPLMLEIQHCIDFIPGASIPNKPAYRLNPKEFAELHRQVTELLEKGLIRESMSPCAVPALLVPKPNDHQALKFIQGQAKLKPRHAKWVEGLQDFNFVIRHKAGNTNTVVGALSRRPALMTSTTVHVAKFEPLKQLYVDDPDFKDVWEKSGVAPFRDYVRRDGLLFKRHLLCVPLSSFREAIIVECHQGALAGHFCRAKIISLVGERFFWPKLVRDVMKVLNRCRVCHIAKTHHTNQGLYTPLPTPTGLWEDTYDASEVARLYFSEIVKLHGVPKTITSDRDVKFVSHFWHTLWKRLGAKLQFSSSHHPQTDGQKEVTNRSLGNLLRCLVGDNKKQWDLSLPQAEFAYNRSTHSLTGRNPFLVVYGRNPFTPLDLAPLPGVETFSAEGNDRAEHIKSLHEQVRELITNHNLQYQARANKHRRKVVFQEGDMVWVFLRRERFPQRRFGKLQPRGDGPFRVLQRINDNAYKIDLPGHYDVSATFNVADLSPYIEGDELGVDSGTSRFLEGKDDTDSNVSVDQAGRQDELGVESG
ncbi:RNA-directed DNA polymerase [Tanacetum coccineum]